MIPKKIHCIWFGGAEFPALDRKCIESWSKYCPDYEIIFWNESNINIKDSVFTKAYSNKQWAYCSDYARLYVLSKYGGVYLDTDVELVKPLDALCEKDQCFLGKENSEFINGAVIGAEFDSKFINDVFIEMKKSMKTDYVPIPKIITEVFNSNTYHDVTIYNEEYFYPYNPFENEVKRLMFSDITDNTVSIHHWNYSWKPGFLTRIYRMSMRIMKGSKYFNYKDKILEKFKGKANGKS